MADTLTHGAGHEAHHGSTGLSNNKLAMWLFLGSETLLFGGLISTYMLYRGRVADGPHPHQVYDIPFTSVSSFVLLMSSVILAEEVHPAVGIAMAAATVVAAAIYFLRSRRSTDTPAGKLASVKP